MESLDIVKGIVTNKYVSKRLDEVHQEVAQGHSLSSSLERTEIFSPLMVNIISVGEEIGKLEETLMKISHIYDRELREETKRWLSLLEPIIILFLALSVGFVVMGMLLPIFSMNLQIL